MKKQDQLFEIFEITEEPDEWYLLTVSKNVLPEGRRPMALVADGKGRELFVLGFFTLLSALLEREIELMATYKISVMSIPKIVYHREGWWCRSV